MTTICCLVFGQLASLALAQAQTLNTVQVLRGPRNQPSGLTFSADGRHAYGASLSEVQLWDRDISSGGLVFRSSVLNVSPQTAGELVVSGVLELSANERFLYVFQSGRTAILSVFARDVTSGNLSLLERFDLQGEASSKSMALSPDGRHLYAGGEVLSYFLRNSETGRLSPLGATGARGTGGISFSADGSLLLVSNGEELQSLRRDAITGELTPADSLSSFTDQVTEQIGFVVSAGIGSDRIYSLVRASDGSLPFLGDYYLVVVHFDATGQLTLEGVTRVSSVFDVLLPGLAVHPSNGEVSLSFFDANSAVGSLVLYEAAEGGSRLIKVGSDSGGSQFGQGLPTTLSYGPEGREVYVASYAGQTLATVQRGDEPGSYGETLPTRSLERPVDLAFLPEGALGIFSPVGFQRAPHPANSFELDQWFRNPSLAGFGIGIWSSALVTPNNRFIVAVSYETDTITVLRRSEDGSLTNTGFSENGSVAALSPDGRFLVFQSFEGLRVSMMDPQTGSLSPLLDYDLGGENVRSLEFSPDGRGIFAVLGSSFPSGNVHSIFLKFTPEAQALEEVSITDPVFLESSSLAPSADGRHLYSIWRTPSDTLELATFERSGEDLSLTDLKSLGPSEVTRRPQLELDPQGRFVYVWDGNGILRSYRRQSETGLPTLAQTHQQDFEGVDWLAPSSTPLDLLADASQLYVANPFTRTIAALSWGCQPSDRVHCFQDKRFSVEVEWEDTTGLTGVGQTVEVSSDQSGMFWFFGPDNWEMLVKVLDACSLANQFWVFAAATTNVGFEMTVTDTWTEEQQIYRNPVGVAASAIVDTGSFEVCSP